MTDVERSTRGCEKGSSGEEAGFEDRLCSLSDAESGISTMTLVAFGLRFGAVGVSVDAFGEAFFPFEAPAVVRFAAVTDFLGLPRGFDGDTGGCADGGGSCISGVLEALFFLGLPRGVRTLLSNALFPVAAEVVKALVELGCCILLLLCQHCSNKEIFAWRDLMALNPYEATSLDS